MNRVACFFVAMTLWSLVDYGCITIASRAEQEEGSTVPACEVFVPISLKYRPSLFPKVETTLPAAVEAVGLDLLLPLVSLAPSPDLLSSHLCDPTCVLYAHKSLQR